MAQREQPSRKIIVGLTGRETTSSRVAYLRDRGANPAVAMNDHGQIIEVHKSETQDMLWFWTGQMQPDGRVIWWHHGRYGSGRDPAIALNNHGYFVEVHRSHSDDDLWTWTGRITETGDLEFLENTEFSEGREPSVSFTDLEGFAFREVHSVSGDAGTRMAWDGVVSATDGGIAWGAHGATTDALFDVDRATSSAGSVAVESVTYGSSGANTLVYETDDHERAHIRYAQIAFIDSNDGDPDLVEDMTPFRSFRTGSHDGARSWRESGGISRVWRFSGVRCRRAVRRSAAVRRDRRAAERVVCRVGCHQRLRGLEHRVDKRSDVLHRLQARQRKTQEHEDDQHGEHPPAPRLAEHREDLSDGSHPNRHV